MEKSIELYNAAKNYLLEKIKETTCFDFEIVSGTMEKKNVYRFDCKYKWTLNSWTKNIERSIYVFYNENTKEFKSAL